MSNFSPHHHHIFRANIAAAAGGIIFFCLYLPYSFMVVWEEVLEPNAKILSSLVSNIAFGFGCAYFSHYEESGVGAQWSNIWISPLSDDHFSLAGCMLMMILDSLIYGVLMWYIEAVFPGEFGVPKPFYFFLTRSYWTGRPSHSGMHLDSPHHEMSSIRDGQNIESEPNLTLGNNFILFISRTNAHVIRLHSFPHSYTQHCYFLLSSVHYC